MKNYSQLINDAKDLNTLVTIGYLVLKDETLTQEERRAIANKIMDKKTALGFNYHYKDQGTGATPDVPGTN